MEQHEEHKARQHQQLNDLRFAPNGLLAGAAERFWQRARDGGTALDWRRAGDASRGLGDFDAAAAAYAHAIALDDEDVFSRQAAQLCRHGAPELALLDAGPPPFVLSEGRLGAYRDPIFKELAQGQDRFIKAGLGGAENPSTNPSIRRAYLRHGKGLGAWAAEARSRLREEMARAATLLGVSLPAADRLGLQMDLTVYQDGDFYRPHTDNARAIDDGVSAHSRLLSFIAYFHRLPRPFEGGDLLLYDRPDGRGALTRIEPIDGRLIIFRSRGLLHEITTVRAPQRRWEYGRITLNGWVYLKPAGQEPRPK